MPKPSGIYQCTREVAIRAASQNGYKIIDFRIPKLGENYLNSDPEFPYPTRAESERWNEVTGDGYWRLILEEL